MSWIAATDPLALVAIQAGQIGTPTKEGAAAGANQLDVKQRSTEIGEPVPIVFARRRDGAGGVLISPGATECRFENDNSNAVTAFYHLVLSEGRISNIQVRDVFQAACRVGSHSQTYDRRAGSWRPENTIVERQGLPKPEASYYCGSVGRYPGMSTLSFRVTVPNGFDQWNRQVHCFIRGGLWVTRLFDNTTGPSDNFADLVRWMLLNSGQLQASLVDTTALSDAAKFLEQNQFRCNTNIKESSNYSDFVTKWAPYFLVAESNTSGKRGLRPLLPTTITGAINTGAITPVFTFTEDEIESSTVEINYTSLATRRPFVAQMIWRQQPDDDFGIIRTAEVRYQGTAPNGPYESHDLSEFCCTENHAVKAGAYILAKRRYTSHTIRFTARPQANNTVVVGGSIIRVRLQRYASTGGISFHDYLYQVERITKTLAGELSYECVHFPIDAQGRSLVALDVVNTTGSGIVLSNNRSGVGCDLNSSGDTTIPPETFTPPDTNFPVIDIGGGTGGGVNPGTPVAPNPNDGLDGPMMPHTVKPTGSPPVAGAALDPGVGVCGTSGRKSLKWYKNGVLLTTFQFNNVGAAAVTYESGQPIPAFLDATSEGILVIGSGEDGNIYTSVTECNDGTVVGQQTVVQPGDIFEGNKPEYSSLLTKYEGGTVGFISCWDPAKLTPDTDPASVRITFYSCTVGAPAGTIASNGLWSAGTLAVTSVRLLTVNGNQIVKTINYS